MSEIEKKTLWKIQDCETLLHKRINSDFVESSCKSVYDRVIKEVKTLIYKKDGENEGRQL